MNGATYTAAVVVSNDVKQSLNIEDVELDMGEVTNVKELMQREGKYIILNPRTGTTEKVMKRTISYRTMNAVTKK